MRKKKKHFLVSTTIDIFNSDTPLEAAREWALDLQEDSCNKIYEVKDVATGKKWTVDLEDDSVIEKKKK